MTISTTCHCGAVRIRVGVNARNFAPDDLGPVRIRRLDGAASWQFLPDTDT